MDRETPLTGLKADRLAQLASTWGDLLYLRQVLSTRAAVPDTAANLFARRAMWEGAVVGYGRCINKGKRARLPKKLFRGLDSALLARHDATINTRNQHVAHRDAAAFERAEVTAVFGDKTADLRSVRVRVATMTGPEEERAADELQELADHLMRRVWEDCIAPLEATLMADHAVDAHRLSVIAAEWTASAQPANQLIVTLNPSS